MIIMCSTPPPKPRSQSRRSQQQHVYSTIEADGDDSDHGCYSEPEPIYSSIDESGRRVDVLVEKDSEGEDTTLGRKRKENGRKEYERQAKVS